MLAGLRRGLASAPAGLKIRLAEPMRLASTVLLAALLAVPLAGDDSGRILTIDHFVRVQSSVPAISGQPAQLYVRERVQAGMLARAARQPDRVVLFVHGAGTPAEVAFDVPYQDYSWMAYLAQAGFDTFSVDMTGYGRSTRPPAMNDPCNLAPNQQAALVPRLLAAPCAPTYGQALTTIASDWDDVGAAVEYIRALRGIERVSLVAWSLGGPRSGGYAARNPQKVHRLVLLAPAYGRESRGEAPAKVPADGVVFNTQSRAEFDANWDRQVGCPVQYEPAASDSVWSAMLQSDAVGATWGPGVRRAPQTTTWGWNAAVVTKTQTPTLMVAGIHDKQVVPERVRELYEDLGASQKVMIDLGCSSHNAMWEKNHTTLFRASLEWLEKGTVNGSTTGVVRLGY
jgi:pimeloyl-ACP methyl ester carboxylesterase